MTGRGLLTCALISDCGFSQLLYSYTMALKTCFFFREKTEKVVEEEKLFKEKELEQLEKKIAEVKS